MSQSQRRSGTHSSQGQLTGVVFHLAAEVAALAALLGVGALLAWLLLAVL